MHQKTIERQSRLNDNAITEFIVFEAAKYCFTIPPRPMLLMGRVAVFIVLGLWGNVSAIQVPADLSFFIGIWTITVKDAPKGNFTWIVKEDLGGEWITGALEKDGERTSTDHWRINSRGIERHVFNSNGTYIKLNGSTWKTGKMSFTGVAYSKDGEYRMRETIFRESDTRFRALWEKQGTDGAWTTVSDEIGSK